MTNKIQKVTQVHINKKKKKIHTNLLNYKIIKWIKKQSQTKIMMIEVLHKILNNNLL